ncbi:NfeD family protein [Rothia kristinae]|uniref:NfeD family protein n=1 Tax=Rothia kristinae TaxID=37923 RepID=UPI002E2D1C0F|nr:NfeD family protein [Rothia kristinae]MED6046257.1 NfeD family protein [Rothia kristinae]
MFDWFAQNPWALWLLVVLLLGVIEMFSLEFVCLMMAGGAVTAVATGSWPIQVLVFAAVSLALLGLVRPSMVRRLNRNTPETRNNAEALVGRPVQALERVTGLQGLVRLEGDVWTARSAGGLSLDTGAFGRVVRIDGATAVVDPDADAGESSVSAH